MDKIGLQQNENFCSNNKEAIKREKIFENHVSDKGSIYNMLKIYNSKIKRQPIFPPSGVAIIKSVVKDEEKLETSFIAGENVKWCSLFGKQFTSSPKV